jgi:hypothetical protein
MRRLIISSAAALATLGLASTAFAATMQFRAAPSGEFEVPPTPSSASADFKLKVSGNEDSARYDLKIDEPIENLRMAHLHAQAAGVNGPIAVWLYPHDASGIQTIPGSFEGRLAEDVITPEDLCFSPTAPFCDASGAAPVGDWDAFIDAVESGGIYVNVHTDQFPGGEIRDQVHHHPDD